MTTLREVLGDEAHTELLALIPQAVPAPAVTPWASWFRGLIKSWTIWFGALLIALPDLLPALMPQLEQTLDANAYKRMANIIGVIVILLRFKTTKSLESKGNPPGQETTP